jgi:hypothetical protein
MSDQDRNREAESRRILDRVEREAEAGGSRLSRAAMRARDHIAAEDADKSDWAEYWGTRIGRSLGIMILVGLLIWLILFIMRG